VTVKVLIIPKGHFGDMLLTGPVFEAIKKSDPDAHVTVLAPPQSADFARRDPFVDEVLIFDRRKEYPGWRGLKQCVEVLRTKGFRRAYSFHRSPRTSLMLFLAQIPERIAYGGSLLSPLSTRLVWKTARFHEVVRNLELVYGDLSAAMQSEVDALKKSGPAPVTDLFSIRVPAVGEGDMSGAVREYVSNSKPFVVLSPGSAWETKRWSPRGFREVATELVSRGYRVALVGAPGDAAACAKVCEGLNLSSDTVWNLCGVTSLLELIHLVSKSKAVVCNDSLALHLASATKVPTVAVFCATSSLFGFGPWKNRAIVVEKADLFCKPCRRHGSRRCPTGTNACMEGVSSSMVLRAFDDLLVNNDVGRRGSGLHIVESPV
jgi:heptosyltransferase-2